MITIEDVLREWRKLALWPLTQIRCRSGQMGEVIGRPGPEDCTGRLMIRLDGGSRTIMERQDLFPIWWPEKQWEVTHDAQR
jgi:hypothetical protein